MSDQSAQTENPQARRRTRRPLLRIPIEVEGTNADGQPFTEDSYTLVVNRNGARIALKNSLKPGDRITITNTQREESCPFRVVERADSIASDHTEWGVECLEPQRNFWGVYFPERPPAEAQGEGIDVLIECSACHTREMAELTMEQYRQLSESAALTRPCAQCGGDTPWEFGFAEIIVEDGEEAAAHEKVPVLTPPGGEERRQTTRFVAMLPLHLHTPDGREETTRTENLSRLGLCFLSNLQLEEGEIMYVRVGPPEDEKKELPARVAWRRPVSASGRSLYGVRLEAEE